MFSPLERQLGKLPLTTHPKSPARGKDDLSPSFGSAALAAYAALLMSAPAGAVWCEVLYCLQKAAQSVGHSKDLDSENSSDMKRTTFAFFYIQLHKFW